MTVPLDRSGALPGGVKLHVTRRRAAIVPSSTAVVALDGGPGAAATSSARSFASELAPAVRARDLLLFDERGTGRSGRLRCPFGDLFLDPVITQVGDCAARLGAARGFYRSLDDAEDLEAVRVAAGYDRLVVYGVSYGTKVAELYAAMHPEHVAALVLDSVVLPEGPDVFSRSSLQATGPVVSDVCARGRCRRISADPARDLHALVHRLARRPLRGRVPVAFLGFRRRVAIGPTDLFGILEEGDFDPLLRADAPAALRGALRGDAAPLMRMLARVADLDTFGDGGGLSEALFVAKRCEESAFPWDPRAGALERRRQALAAARTIRPAQRGGFPPRTAYASDVLALCLGWLNAGPPPFPAPGCSSCRTAATAC